MTAVSRPRLLIAAVILALVLVVPALFADSGRYQAVSSGVQAFGLIVTLVFAALAIRNDTRDKRVDRVIELYDRVAGEPVYDARVRLAGHLRPWAPDRYAASVRTSFALTRWSASTSVIRVSLRSRTSTGSCGSLSAPTP